MAGGNWQACLVDVKETANWNNRFKLEVVRDEAHGPARYPGGMPRVINIRTDVHPQSPLDATTLNFEGGTFDGSKTYGGNRRFVVKYVVEEDVQTPFMAFESCDGAGYLGVGADGQVVMQTAGDGPLPQSVRWVGSPSSHFFAWTPTQVGIGCALLAPSPSLPLSLSLSLILTRILPLSRRRWASGAPCWPRT